MIILQMSGGLGNQMFQYALYLKLKDLGKDVRIDDSTCYKKEGTREKQLAIFKIQYLQATNSEIINMTDSSMNCVKRIRRKIFGRKDLSYRADDYSYDHNVFQMSPVYLEGCFQNEEYFKDIKELVLEKFEFPIEQIPDDSKAYLELIEKTLSVSIHIRRGDYLDDKNIALFGNICTADYYKNAIALMEEKQENCIFYIFTNDKEWAKENFKENNIRIIEGNADDKGYWDLFLMSRCKHNIIANSSFSWWGSWLNHNPDKIIIAPSKWVNGRNADGIYTENMIVGKC